MLKPINSILYRCTGVIIDREETYALRSVEVYMCLTERCFYMPNTSENMQIYSKPSFIEKGFYFAAFYIGG